MWCQEFFQRIYVANFAWKRCKKTVLPGHDPGPESFGGVGGVRDLSGCWHHIMELLEDVFALFS